MKEQVDHRVKHVVNRRYQRDLVLGLLAILGIMIGAVLASIFLKPVFKKLGDASPEVAAAVMLFIICFSFFIKYARK